MSRVKMAASLGASIISNLRSQVLTSGHWRLYATSCKKLEADRRPRVAMAPDESCIICWHPEPEFPYDCTQPLSRREEELAQGESPLKVSLLQEEQLKMRPDGPTDNELCNIFFTTKHAWRPMPGKKYRKPQKELDREGL